MALPPRAPYATLLFCELALRASGQGGCCATPLDPLASGIASLARIVVRLWGPDCGSREGIASLARIVVRLWGPDCGSREGIASLARSARCAGSRGAWDRLRIGHGFGPIPEPWPRTRS